MGGPVPPQPPSGAVLWGNPSGCRQKLRWGGLWGSPGQPAPRRVWAKWNMDEDVAESWEEAADSGVNNKSLNLLSF